MKSRTPFGQRLAVAISDDPFARPAVDELIAYLGNGPASSMYTGRHFETYATAETSQNRIAAADLVAMTFLSMQISRRSKSGFTPVHALAIDHHAHLIASLLKQIPNDRALCELTSQEFDRWLGGEESPGPKLWNLLRNEIGTPPVATYKLLARKRPHLLPIRDSATSAALGRGWSWWAPWWRALNEDPSFSIRLRQLHSQAQAPPHLSLLRVADIVIWMRRGKQSTTTSASPHSPSGAGTRSHD